MQQPCSRDMLWLSFLLACGLGIIAKAGGRIWSFCRSFCLSAACCEPIVEASVETMERRIRETVIGARSTEVLGLSEGMAEGIPGYRV